MERKIDEESLKKIKFLKIFCGMDEDNLYYGCMNFFKYFSEVENLYIEGEIKNIEFLKYYTKLKVLTINGYGDMSKIIEKLAEITTLKNIEEFVLNADKLTYLCENDFRNMPNLKYLEIHCCDNTLELNFADFEYTKNLEKILFDVDFCLEDDIERQIPLWKQKNSNLEIEFV